MRIKSKILIATTTFAESSVESLKLLKSYSLNIIKNNKPNKVYRLAILRSEWNEIKPEIVTRLKKVNII